MNNDVTITLGDGQEIVISQEDIVAPKFDCDGCFTPAEYVAKISEMGITTVTQNPDGTYTYEKISPHCICKITFTPEC